MPPDDLWGDLPEAADLRTPIVILKEQGEMLKEKTKGLLTADIPTSQEGTNFKLSFFIVAPTLGNYRFHLLNVSHGLGFYPVIMVDVARSVRMQCNDEAEFKKNLKEAFGSEQIRAVIARLLTHIKAEK